MIAPCNGSESVRVCHPTMLAVDCISNMVRRCYEISLSCNSICRVWTGPWRLYLICDAGFAVRKGRCVADGNASELEVSPSQQGQVSVAHVLAACMTHAMPLVNASGGLIEAPGRSSKKWQG